jgi:SAM-dependent methyltransferase
VRENPFAHSSPGTPVRPAAVDEACLLCGSIEKRTLFRKHGYGFARCLGCSLVRLDPVPDEDTLREVYERSYREGLYAVFARADDVRSATARARLEVIARHAPPGPWLDAGCSTGAFLAAASKAGIDIEGFDLSAAAVEEARRNHLRATQASAETFVPSQRYSCVTAFDLVEHLIDPHPFLERARSWLAPNGKIALTVPDIKSPAARLMRRWWYYYAPPVHITYFDRRTVCRLLERHGLHPIAISSAPKVLTADYALSQLEAFNPLVHRLARAAAAVVPGAVRRRPFPIPTGEILVVASG